MTTTTDVINNRVFQDTIKSKIDSAFKGKRGNASYPAAFTVASDIKGVSDIKEMINPSVHVGVSTYVNELLSFNKVALDHESYCLSENFYSDEPVKHVLVDARGVTCKNGLSFIEKNFVLPAKTLLAKESVMAEMMLNVVSPSDLAFPDPNVTVEVVGEDGKTKRKNQLREAFLAAHDDKVEASKRFNTYREAFKNHKDILKNRESLEASDVKFSVQYAEHVEHDDQEAVDSVTSVDFDMESVRDNYFDLVSRIDLFKVLRAMVNDTTADDAMKRVLSHYDIDEDEEDDEKVPSTLRVNTFAVAKNRFHLTVQNIRFSMKVGDSDLIIDFGRNTDDMHCLQYPHNCAKSIRDLLKKVHEEDAVVVPKFYKDSVGQYSLTSAGLLEGLKTAKSSLRKAMLLEEVDGVTGSSINKDIKGVSKIFNDDLLEKKKAKREVVAALTALKAVEESERDADGIAALEKQLKTEHQMPVFDETNPKADRFIDGLDLDDESSLGLLYLNTRKLVAHTSDRVKVWTSSTYFDTKTSKPVIAQLKQVIIGAKLFEKSSHPKNKIFEDLLDLEVFPAPAPTGVRRAKVAPAPPAAPKAVRAKRVAKAPASEAPVEEPKVKKVAKTKETEKPVEPAVEPVVKPASKPAPKKRVAAKAL